MKGVCENDKVQKNAGVGVRVLIAASGTGGHLFPAVDIARAFQKIDEKAEVMFVGSGRYLEAEIIDKAGFTRSVIDIVGIKQRGLSGLIEFCMKLPSALLQGWGIISRFKPDIVIGVGGYVTVIPVVLAWLRGIPTWIHEAERSPGMANRFLAHISYRISVAFQDAQVSQRDKVVYTGQPIREVFKEIAAENKEVDIPRNLLITGGSQGANALDTVAEALMPFFKEKNLNIRHQCRQENLEKLKAAYAENGVTAEVMDFIQDLPESYRWSDLIIARAGAGSTMEIGVINRPTIFVPFPFAQGNHQLKNAQILADAGKALIVEEGDEFCNRLEKALTDLLTPAIYNKMRAAPYRSRSLDAAENIAKGCLKILKIKKGKFFTSVEN